METIIIVIISLLAVTLIYKALPCRELGQTKPFLAFLPKYKISISHSLDDDQIQALLEQFGFKKKNSSEVFQKYTRGHILGDFSIKLSKVNVGLRKLSENTHEITVQAGWVAAFDTGDHWVFTKELSDKIHNA